MVSYYANPSRFFSIADRVQPWLWAVTGVLLTIGLVWALFFVPEDYQQGHTVRIMYVHVPSAWLCMFVYASMATASFIALVWRHPLAEIAALASAPIGTVFTVCTLITGMLWGQPMWGTWWEWDARMTSVLILLFIYLGYMALVNGFDDAAAGRRIASVYALVGVVILPIIKYSVDWWNTLHQPASVLRFEPTIHSSMLWPLLLMGVAFMALYFCLLLVRMRSAMDKARIRSLRLAHVRSIAAKEDGV